MPTLQRGAKILTKSSTIWAGMGNITLLWLFSIAVPFSRSLARSNRCTNSYAEWLNRRVFAQGRSFWESGQWWRHVEKIRPKTPQKETWTEEAISSQPEVKLLLSGRHLANRYRMVRFGWNSAPPSHAESHGEYRIETGSPSRADNFTLTKQ